MALTAPRRADAARNREHIVAAARALLTTSQDVPLNAVAKRAGVGQGTLYRHFSTREQLIAEVYRHEVDDLVAAAGDLLAESDPVQALAGWFDRLIDYARVKRGVLAAVEASTWEPLSAQSHGRIGWAITTLLDAGKSAGLLRQDVGARDVVLLIGYLTRLNEAEWDTRARPLLQIILDGLRSPHHPSESAS